MTAAGSHTHLSPKGSVWCPICILRHPEIQGAVLLVEAQMQSAPFFLHAYVACCGLLSLYWLPSRGMVLGFVYKVLRRVVSLFLHRTLVSESKTNTPFPLFFPFRTLLPLEILYSSASFMHLWVHLLSLARQRQGRNSVLIVLTHHMTHVLIRVPIVGTHPRKGPRPTSNPRIRATNETS